MKKRELIAVIAPNMIRTVLKIHGFDASGSDDEVRDLFHLCVDDGTFPLSVGHDERVPRRWPQDYMPSKETLDQVPVHPEQP